MSKKLESSKADGVHGQLNRLTGDWEGKTTVWFEPDKFADQSPVRGRMRSIMDGRFIIHEYKGSFGGKPLEGMAIIGYHLETGKYQTAWIDSFHNGTAIMFSESSRHAAKFQVLGSYEYVTPEVDQKWGWRTEVELVNDNELKLTSYNVTPEGSEAKATETVYTRVRSGT
jgi:Protein of unknown function (DUF1579)